MITMKTLILLCTLALIAGSVFAGCASAEKKPKACAGTSCCH